MQQHPGGECPSSPTSRTTAVLCCDLRACIAAWHVNQLKPKAPPKPPQKTPLLLFLEERFPTAAALTAALHGDGSHVIREMPDRLLPPGGADIRGAIMRGLGVQPPKRPRQLSAALVAAAAANPQFFASHAPSILARATRQSGDAAGAGGDASTAAAASSAEWPLVPADLAVTTEAQYHSCIHSISLALGGFFGSESSHVLMRRCAGVMQCACAGANAARVP